MVKLSGQWLNPDHVAQIIPDREFGGCEVHLLAGPTVYLPKTAAEVAELILRAQGAGQ
jgi:hypothetical protein